MNALQVFNYNGNDIRITDDNGDIWFVAKDVCDILGLTNAREAMNALEDDEKSTVRISDGTSPKGGNPNMNIISESGFYTLVLRSNKPEAKPFRRWVTKDVLPQIRKTGSYSLLKEQPKLPDGVIDGARIIFEAAGLKDNQKALALDKIYKSYTGRSALMSGEVELIAPTKNQLLTPKQIGAHYGISPRKVNQILAEAGWQYKLEGNWELLEPGKQYGEFVDVNKWHSDGSPVRQLKWSSAIIEPFGELLKQLQVETELKNPPAPSTGKAGTDETV